MSAWIELKTGAWVNLDLIEAVVPCGGGIFRFYPPRAQRGGRPTGRPTPQVMSYNDDRGYWEGVPVDLRALLAGLGWPLDGSGASGHRITSYTPHSPQGGSHEPQRPYQHQDRVTGSASPPPD